MPCLHLTISYVARDEPSLVAAPTLLLLLLYPANTTVITASTIILLLLLLLLLLLILLLLLLVLPVGGQVPSFPPASIATCTLMDLQCLW